MSSSTVLAAKLFSGLLNRSQSRSATPDAASPRMTPPRTISARMKSDSPKGITGVKRKIDSVDGVDAATMGHRVGIVGDGSPPLKKKALATD